MIDRGAHVPTRVRYAVLGIATANAFILYLDRICMGAVVQSASFQQELGLNKDSVGDVLASFFFAYAIGQLPAGWLADRFGPRRMLVAYILLWSLFTGLTGFVGGLIGLIDCPFCLWLVGSRRLSCKRAIDHALVSLCQRARANSIVSLGGRMGNSLALWLTAGAIALLGSWRPVLWIYGAIGIVLALATHVVFRDDPTRHPWTNEAERELIRTGALEFNRCGGNRPGWRCSGIAVCGFSTWERSV